MVNPELLCLDELAPATQRERPSAKRLSSNPIERAKALLEDNGYRVDPPLLTDAEKRTLFVEVWDEAGEKCLLMHFILHLDQDGKPFHVTFQRDWRVLVRTLDRDVYDSATEEWLTDCAMRAWAKRGGRS